MNYCHKTWRAIRAAVLRRDEYLCQECRRYGITTDGTEVHHVLPVEQCVGGYERLKYDSRNLVTLCRDCHNAMHNRTDDTLTERGETLLRRSGVLRLGKNPPPRLNSKYLCMGNRARGRNSNRAELSDFVGEMYDDRGKTEENQAI